MNDRARPVLILIATLWLIELADAMLAVDLDAWGIRPRETKGLIGIVCAPFLHGGWAHLVANTVPLLALGVLAQLGSRRSFAAVTAEIAVIGGLGTWVIGSDGVHIGASGLVFGFLGYTVARGLYERRIGSLLIAVVAGVLYGGIVFGVLPSRPGVSWEGHLCGLIAGVVSARGAAKDRNRDSAS